MSFQGLMSGSECALPANPLSQVLKHTEGDRSLQQDRIGGPSSSRLHHIASTPANTSEHDLAQARHFFGDQAPRGQMPLSGLPLPPSATELQLRPGLVHRNTSSPNLQHEALWHQHSQADPHHHQWASEFESSSATATTAGGHLVTNSHGQSEASRPYYPNNAMSMMTPRQAFYGPGLNSSYPMGLGMQQQQLPHTTADIKGKGKSVDFDAAFAQYSDYQTSSSGVEEVKEGAEETTTTTISKEDPGVAQVTEEFGKTSLDPDFKQVWDQLQNSDMPPPQTDMAKWESEFQQLMQNQRDDFLLDGNDEDYISAMRNSWENGFSEPSQIGTNGLRFDNDGYPILGDYEFEKQNKYLDPSTSSTPDSYLAAAKALLEQNGSLSEAGLLLEAAIQKGDVGQGGYEAWILLGEVRNMDEREESGMKALMEGVKLAQNAGAPGEGMMALAISFTNENYDRASHSTLIQWMKARYPEHPLPAGIEESIKTHSTWDTHDKITQVFMDLARMQHAKGVVDPDVQIALGVLFYTNNEYDRAKDCFETALSMRPNDYQLWNRLGSCLSNGQKAEEALGAYREALQIRPTYTRAIYNVGVACLNIGAHKEAAEHLLSAIAMQEATGADTSDQLWLTLRRTFLAMERNDLVDLTKPESRRSLDTFRKEGFDF